MVVTVTQGGYIKRTALGRFPCAKTRRQGPVRHGHQGRGRGHHAVRGQHPHPVAVLFHRRHGLQAQDMAAAAGGRTSKGKAIVNILPIPQGVSIAAIMPVDVPEEDWNKLQIVFATSAGDVRRNALSDFTNVKSNGKIAMKLPDEETKLVNARICSADGRCDAGHARRPRDPLSGDGGARPSRGAIPPVCAASACNRMTGSCPCACWAISRPRPTNAPPISRCAARWPAPTKTKLRSKKTAMPTPPCRPNGSRKCAPPRRCF